MHTLRRIAGILTVVVVLGSGFGAALAADSSAVDRATEQVESGAKEAGKGLSEMGKGIGNTVVEGAKHTGEKLQEAGEAAEPKAKEVGEDIETGAQSFFTGVKNFFGRLFGAE